MGSASRCTCTTCQVSGPSGRSRSVPCWAPSDSTQASCRVCTQRRARRANRSTGVLRNVPARRASSGSGCAGRSRSSRTDCRASRSASQANRVAAVWRVWCVLTPTTSSTRQSVLPGYVRVPRPSICWYSGALWVGRATIIQSTEGSSKPSVSTAQLATTRVAPVCKREDGPAGGERRRPIQRLGGDTGRPKNLRHGVGQSHRGGKQEGFTVRRMGLKGGEDLRRSVSREEEALQLGFDKIPLLDAQGIEIRLEQDLQGAQVDEIARLHHLQQGFLIDDAVKIRP